MAYSVVVVDDERIICTGISNIISTSIDGFVIVAQFSDGREAIEYLKSNPVDIILTDIKMTFSSGLDIAQYVYDNKLNTKVVLLSGHQDFSLAQQAIRYGVHEYLLKPTSISQLKEIFARIKAALDEEKALSYYQNEMIPSLQQYFFEALLLHVPDDKLLNVLRLLNAQWRDEKWAVVLLNLSVSMQIEEMAHFKQTVESVLLTYGQGLHLAALVPQEDQIQIMIRLEISEDSNKSTAEQLEDLFMKVLSYLCLENPPHFSNVLVYKNFQTLVEEMTTLQSDDTAAKLEASSSLAQIKQLIQSGDQPLSENEGAERLIVRRAREFIARNCTLDITLESVAREFYLSSAYFSVLFKKETGSNFIDYLAHCKMNAAAQLLHSTNNRVYEIARQVGYLSIKHFNKIFKEQFGCTPTEYRDKGQPA